MLAASSLSIHPSAVVEPGAKLDPDVEIGPLAVVYAGARLGAGTRVGSQCTIYGEVSLGENNVVHPGAVLGGPPQSVGFDIRLPSRVEIGAWNVFREGVTVHRSEREDGVTRIGNHGFFMANSHIAHDCVVGDHVIMANNSKLAGHAEIGERVFMSADTMVHQFTRVGRLAFMQGKAGITLDLPPFTIAAGSNRIAGVHAVGLRRAGVSESSRKALQRVYRALFLSGRQLARVLEELGDDLHDPYVAELVGFIRSSRRGVLRRQRTQRGGARDAEA